MDDKRATVKRVLGGIGGAAKAMKLARLKEKFGMADEGAPPDDAEAPPPEGMDEAPGELEGSPGEEAGEAPDEALEEAKQAVAALDEGQLQELLQGLKQ